MNTPCSPLQTSEFLQYLDRFCHKTFANDADAGECYLYILDKLEEDNCKKLREHDGRASVFTFLKTICANLMADFMRKKFGRRRVPAAIQKIGAWATTVYKLICWEKRTTEDAWVAITARRLYSRSFSLYLDDLEAVLAHPCPESVQITSIDAENCPEPQAEDNPFTEFLRKLEREKMAKAAQILHEQTLAFSGTEKLIIQMAYTENCKDTAIARALNCDQRTVKKRRLALLAHYRKALFQQGISGL